jgi:hypothetical protein
MSNPEQALKQCSFCGRWRKPGLTYCDAPDCVQARCSFGAKATGKQCALRPDHAGEHQSARVTDRGRAGA